MMALSLLFQAAHHSKATWERFGIIERMKSGDSGPGCPHRTEACSEATAQAEMAGCLCRSHNDDRLRPKPTAVLLCEADDYDDR
jgi:hypothetical protein